MFFTLFFKFFHEFRHIAIDEMQNFHDFRCNHERDEFHHESIKTDRHAVETRRVDRCLIDHLFNYENLTTKNDDC